MSQEPNDKNIKPTTAKTKQNAREMRLKSALKANMAKRKAQVRARNTKNSADNQAE
ncbi:hypothetical protein ACFE33_04450 [Falsihalocynthiibacter sp. SS001]|uniref:hypothetical protein n=1 Tax=Falsihalocynthiibacter sp. SS001 TaxID=3349698 RepID=UPI0036D2AEB5